MSIGHLRQLSAHQVSRWVPWLSGASARRNNLRGIDVPTTHLTSKLFRAALLSSAMISTAVISGAAFAQDSSEELIVTGSRIPRLNLSAPTAVTTIDSSQIDLSGGVNVANILQSVPSFGVPGLSSNNSNFLTSGFGINTLELRNLGESRTLVLVNGRRYVGGVPGTSDVDFNTIPPDLIDRVEVVTGGASAIYGSDALAGVVNVMLKKNFEGITASAQYGETTEHNDDETTRLTTTLGGNFADNKGNAVLSVNWTQENGVMARDRDETDTDNIVLCALTTAPCNELFEPFYSSYSAYGRFNVISTGEAFTVSSGTGPTGTVVPFSTNTYGFNRQGVRAIKTPTERLLLSALGHYEVTDNINVYTEAMYANTEANAQLEPFPLGNADLNIDGISIDNPYMPDDIRNAAIAAGDTEVGFRRRLVEIGNRGGRATRDQGRFVVGANGTIFDKYAYDMYYEYGRSDSSQITNGQVNVSNFREALDVVEDTPGDLSTAHCADPVAVAEGCVPINVFGLGSITPDAIKYVAAPQNRIARVRQEVGSATLGGPLFALPAGDVKFSVGAEYRREDSADEPDALTITGQNAGNKEPPTVGSFDVWELFGEADVPLIKDQPFIKELSIGGAYRYSNYNTVGSTTAYSGRAQWSPWEPLRFRLQYAHAVRAPNINELFSPGGEDFAPVLDPCNLITAATPGTVADNCRMDPAIAARIAATGSFTLSQPEIQGTGGTSFTGNQNLSPEKSNSWNGGFVLNQDLGGAGHLEMSVDYFDIDISDVIDTVGRNDTLTQCYDDASTFPNAFCAAIVRDEDTTGPAFQRGEVLEINTGYFNLGTLKTQGVDTSFSYSFDVNNLVGSIYSGNAGNLALRANWAYLLEYKLTELGISSQSRGAIEVPVNKVQAAAVWTLDPITFSWDANIMTEQVVSDGGYTIGDYVTHDMQIAYDLPGGHSSVYAGLDNVFDAPAPIVGSGLSENTTGTNTDASVFDPIGRRWYAGVRVKF
jgi:outer membrane receptor protein involved in Fe transport